MLSARFRYFMLKRTRAVILDSKNSWRCVIAIHRARAIHLSPVSSTEAESSSWESEEINEEIGGIPRHPVGLLFYMDSELHRIQIEVAVESTVNQ